MRRAWVQLGPEPGPSGQGSCGSSRHRSRASSLEESYTRMPGGAPARRSSAGSLAPTFGDVSSLVDGGEKGIAVASTASRGFAEVHGGRWSRWRWGRTAASRSWRGSRG